MIKSDRTPVLWVSEWPLRTFFLFHYIDDLNLKSSEERMEIVWAIVNKMLLAKDAEVNHFLVSEEMILKEVEELKKQVEVKLALQTEKLEEEDLFLFVKIDLLSQLFINQIKEKIREDLKGRENEIRDYYEKANDFILKDAYLLEAFSIGKDKENLLSESFFDKEKLLKEGIQFKKIGYFDEKMLEVKFPENYKKILGNSEKKIILIREDNDIKHFIYLSGHYEEVKKDYEEVEEDLKNFFFEHSLENILEGIYENLLEKYPIEYNEDFFNHFLGD
ncbi:MAG TPA: hypothetical protein DHW82_08710 [Spirochaetia bacterium]|nr:MAG: hypothetical protein A2Y41_05065 [Spirochaetes bacterium GWB1_36_13]HCL57071.1 hypothetical protein [Spirochaetia bacterium]